MFAILLHGTHANAIDIDNRAALIHFQPEIDLVRTRLRALNLGFDMDFAGSPLHALHPHPAFDGISLAALQCSAVKLAGKLAESVSGGKEIGSHSRVEDRDKRGSATIAHTTGC